MCFPTFVVVQSLSRAWLSVTPWTPGFPVPSLNFHLISGCICRTRRNYTEQRSIIQFNSASLGYLVIQNEYRECFFELMDLSPCKRGEAPAEEMTAEWERRSQVITLQGVRRTSQLGTCHLFAPSRRRYRLSVFQTLAMPHKTNK